MNRADEYPGWLLRTMLGIPSVSGQERRLATFLAEQMASLGMTAHVDKVGNAHGVVGPAGAPTVMLLGHIDTVPGRVPVCQVGDLLFGRGAVDAKGPLAAMICAATRVTGVRVHIIGAIGEEVAGSRGARHAMATVARPDAIVIAEPSGWDGVCLGYKGRIGVGYEVSTPPLHTSSPEPTAVELATELSLQVQDYLRSVSASADPIAFDAASGTLVQLNGDIAHAEAFLTCRVPPRFDFDAFEDHARSKAEGRIWFDERVSAVRRSRSDQVATALRAAISSVGGDPTLKLKAGTSDMNVVDTWETPMAAYGPGDAHLDHTSDEHIPLGELAKSIEVLVLALEQMGRRLSTASDTAGANTPDAVVTSGAGTGGR